MPAQQRPTRLQEAYRARLEPLLAFLRHVVRERLQPRLASLVLPVRADSLLERGEIHPIRGINAKNTPKGIGADSNPASRMDASEEGLSILLDEMATEVSEEFPSRDLVALTQPIAWQTSSFQREQLNRQLRSQIGADPFIADRGLQARVQAFTQENVALIKSIPSEFFGDLEKKLSRDIADGARSEQLAADIEDELGVTEDRAALIARDQVNKFFGDLNEARQTELGVESYIWRTADDERVRGNPEGKYPKADPSHYDRAGHEFQWDDPPEDGHPGEPINCRCVAEPVIPELDGETSGENPDVEES